MNLGTRAELLTKGSWGIDHGIKWLVQLHPFPVPDPFSILIIPAGVNRESNFLKASPFLPFYILVLYQTWLQKESTGQSCCWSSITLLSSKYVPWSPKSIHWLVVYPKIPLETCMICPLIPHKSSISSSVLFWVKRTTTGTPTFALSALLAHLSPREPLCNASPACLVNSRRLGAGCRPEAIVGAMVN